MNPEVNEEIKELKHEIKELKSVLMYIIERFAAMPIWAIEIQNYQTKIK
jgi:hypothetical protein